MTRWMAMVLVALTSGQLRAQEAAIRQEMSEPFCYFLVPSDVLGFKDCPEGAQITHDGAINTSFGEFDLFAGTTLLPVEKRVKTLHRGYLPIVEYTFERYDCTYRVQAFGAPIDLDPRQNLILFVRVNATFGQTYAQRAAVGCSFVDPHGEARAHLPCQEWYRDRFHDAEAWKGSSEIVLEEGRAWRGDHLVYLYDPQDAETDPQAAVGKPQVAYRLEPRPRQSYRIDFKVPYVPVHRERTDIIEAIAAASHEDYLQRSIAFWEGVLAKPAQILLPEAKVIQTHKTSLLYDLIARDITEDGKGFVQKVNEFQYDSFYPRDSAYIIRTYDLLGLHDIAEETLQTFIVRDDEGRPEGLRRLHPDDWGQSLWTIGAHFGITGDEAYLREVYPAVGPHLQAFVEACEEDPLGLWTVAGPYDNELVTGHYTGHNFFAQLGLSKAIDMARALGREEDVSTFSAIRDGHRERFLTRLREVAADAEGYIPPGLDDANMGNDWANASGGVYPFGVLDPFDPMVTATVEMVREHKYREGIMTYGPNAWVIKQKERKGLPADPGWLHHYETFYVVQTLLARGEQRKVIEDFYSILAHTGSTHSGFEFSIRPWGNRDPGGNRPPHGWFAARYNALLRNMLLREEGTTLHLASALSPVWVGAGARVGIQGGPTDFGRVSYEMTCSVDGAEVVISSEWRDPPERILFHVPWFLEIGAAWVDAKPVEVKDGAIELPPTAQRLSLKWQWRERPALSSDLAVSLYLQKYHRRPEDADYGFIFPTPRPPRVVPRGSIFVDSMEVELRPPGRVGKVHYTLDGTRPDETSPIAEGSIRLTDTTTIRAFTVWPDGRTSAVLERTLTKVSPVEPVTVEGLVPGVEFAYCEGEWDRLPRFDDLTPARTGTTPSFDLGKVGHREDDFAVVFAGYLDVPADGIWRLSTISDDGSALFVGDTLVVDNDGLHPTKEEGGEIALRKGKHPIRVAFFERGSVQLLRVLWEGPGVEREDIPPSVLLREE